MSKKDFWDGYVPEPVKPYRQLQDNGSKYFGESWDKAEQPAQQGPVAWMEMVVANLVREGVNKHKARELAQHFAELARADEREACAEIADSMDSLQDGAIGRAIRARGNT